MPVGMNEIGVQVALGAAGAAGVVGGYKISPQKTIVPVHDICDDQRGKHMGADHRIEALPQDKVI